ncbi:MAG: hypothetical protein IPP93_15665 [Chitinophagaceae bacterium]|nr:hypothetical protein [Chitinophagaceae bacterium]MBL0335442.1 hypothetical protein [Chitinophagaceae bacterium]
MRKLVLGALVAMFISGSLAAQSYVGSLEYNKKKQDAILIDLPYPPEAAQNAITQRFEKLGYKPKEEKGILNRDKGILVYRSAFMNEISNGSLDYLIKVEKKSRKEKDECVLYITVQKDGAPVTNMDADIADRLKSFLNNLVPDVEAANLEIQIKDQEDVVLKAEKKLSGLKEDHETLEKKLTDNENSQAETQKDIENQKMRLGELKGKRRN